MTCEKCGGPGAITLDVQPQRNTNYRRADPAKRYTIHQCRACVARGIAKNRPSLAREVLTFIDVFSIPGGQDAAK